MDDCSSSSRDLLAGSPAVVEAGAFLHASKEVSAMSLLGRVAQKAVMARLGCLKEGRLTVQENGNTHVFGSGNTPSATVAIRDESFFRALAFGGHVGTVDAFMDGLLDRFMDSWSAVLADARPDAPESLKHCWTHDPMDWWTHSLSD